MPQYSNDNKGIYFAVEDGVVLLRRNPANGVIEKAAVTGWSTRPFVRSTGKTITESTGKESGKTHGD